MVRLALAVLVAGAALAAQSRPADDKAFPHTKSFGRATIQFQDDTVHMVALYDYSQRNHDGAWLVLQTGVAVKKRTTVNRGNFHIEMPDGRGVPLPSQEHFLADSAADHQAAAEREDLRQGRETVLSRRARTPTRCASSRCPARARCAPCRSCSRSGRW